MLVGGSALLVGGSPARSRSGSPLGGFADLKELPWFPRHLRNLGRPLLSRSGGPFTTGEPRRGWWLEVDIN
ncbi:MAG: hypothetical protein ACHBN1_15600 [Heteroscytonema crispum UTEX LB 1556]